MTSPPRRLRRCASPDLTPASPSATRPLSQGERGQIPLPLARECLKIRIFNQQWAAHGEIGDTPPPYPPPLKFGLSNNLSLLYCKSPAKG